MKKPISHMDFVKKFADDLAKDNSLFAQQKVLIESQLDSSKELFRKMFSPDFNKNARKYLKSINSI